jgi:hypothetical protein
MRELITSGKLVNIANTGLWTHRDSLSQGNRTIKPGLSRSLEAAALPNSKTVIWYMKTYHT